MRLPYAFLILSCAVLGSATLVVPQDQKTAEQQYKNIVSFKGAKASDVIPAMEFISASLGVGCDFCHTQDRASDEKPEKTTARHMIAMQREINEKNFNGRNEVTCATCHGGHAHPVSQPKVDGMDVRARRSADVDPAQVLAAFGKATGSAVGAVRAEGSQTARGRTSDIEALYADGKYVITQKQGGAKTGYDGSVAWFGAPGSVRTVPAEVSLELFGGSLLYPGQSALPTLQNPSGGTAKMGDRNMQTVTGILAPRNVRVTLFFDKATGLLARASYLFPSVLGSMLHVTDYSDYRSADGIMVPTKVVSHTPGGDSLLQFTSLSLDKSVDASAFRPPK